MRVYYARLRMFGTTDSLDGRFALVHWEAGGQTNIPTADLTIA